MSLILEALRKSEAERRRGSAPDVAMELPPVAVARARATPAWLLPAVLLGAIALLAAWWWSQRDADAGSDTVSVEASQPVATRIATPAQPVVVARPTHPIATPPAQAQAQAGTSTTAQSPPTVAESAPPPAKPLPTPPPAPMPAAADRPIDIDATSLPPVKLSMHMWDESPAKRFVILDGQRMAEGERNGEVTVVAIERDGVVIERNGQRARVPLP